MFTFRRQLFSMLLILLVAGCDGARPMTDEEMEEMGIDVAEVEEQVTALAEEEATEEQNEVSMLQRRTQEVELYNPEDAEWVISDSDVEMSNPITGALEAYGPIVEQISKSSIDYHINLFNAERGRYPSYNEFMEHIIHGPTPIELPVIPGKRKYAYDEPNHKLLVLKPAPAEEASE